MEIGEDGKKYFKYIVEETEKLSFDDDSRRSELGYDEKYFKALRRFYDKQRKNADSRSEEFDF